MAMRARWEELIRRGGGGGGILGGTNAPEGVHGEDWRDDYAEMVECFAGREFDSEAKAEGEQAIEPAAEKSRK